MAITAQNLRNFTTATVTLQSFPLFVGYILLVLVASIWQRFTRPLQLRLLLVVYNISLSVTSLITLYYFIMGLVEAPYIYYKGPTNETTFAMKIYWITKVVELLDTVFMVVRHKSRQITFLHVYHHASMLLLSDYGYHVTPWPAIAFILSINSFVHVVLYFYYGLTAAYPNSVPWWKPRITELQIFQFFIAFIYAFYGYAYHGFCIYGIMYGVGMTTLFSNFYYQAYVKPKTRKALIQNDRGKKE